MAGEIALIIVIGIAAISLLALALSDIDLSH